MTKFKEIVINEPTKTPPKSEWGRSSQPYCLCFLHSPEGSFLIKGYPDEVEKTIKTHFPISVYYKSYWQDGKSRGYWRFETGNRRKSICIREPNTRRGQRHYEFYGWDSTDHPQTYLKLRRIPNKWIPEYTKILEQQS